MKDVGCPKATETSRYFFKWLKIRVIVIDNVFGIIERSFKRVQLNTPQK